MNFKDNGCQQFSQRHKHTASWNNNRQCQYGNGCEPSTAEQRISVASWTRLYDRKHTE